MVVIKARLFAAQSPESGLDKIGEALCNVADPVDFAAQAWEINDVEGECNQRAWGGVRGAGASSARPRLLLRSPAPLQADCIPGRGRDRVFMESK
ncbi:hypothetical protein [Paracidovorax anthurii]|uniref:hypothetical protein n=1 Tax=Paracidovorax anthurii TaxID=78229 RepID=UPI0011BD52D0|nr:hypothetical protein [Paracidovorax anthurii]